MYRRKIEEMGDWEDKEMIKRSDKMNEHKCDKNGDKREGWDNCFDCGKTDWIGLYKHNFKPVEVVDMVLQCSDLSANIIEDEMNYILAHIPDMNMSESTDDHAIETYVASLSKKNRMFVYIQAHDEIFQTSWVANLRRLRRYGVEI